MIYYHISCVCGAAKSRTAPTLPSTAQLRPRAAGQVRRPSLRGDYSYGDLTAISPTIRSEQKRAV